MVIIFVLRLLTTSLVSSNFSRLLEVELSGVFNDPKTEEREVKEIKLLNLDDSDFSDDEEGKIINVLAT
jgi:hypothetical protein